MDLIVGALVVVLAVVSSVSGQFCNVNEQFVECVNPCNTCNSGGISCIQACFPGCDCFPGFMRDSYGMCVPADYCDFGVSPFGGYGGGPTSVAVDPFGVGDDAGCPRNNLCNRSCVRRRRRGGFCVGPRRRFCRCFG